MAFRYNDWKAVFCEQPAPGGFRVWYENFDCYRVPKIFNLRMDPFERADVVSDQYDDWRTKNAYYINYMSGKAIAFLQSFVDWPPSQIPASFTIDQIEENVKRQVMEKMQKK